jgi:hypothetical protein
MCPTYFRFISFILIFPFTSSVSSLTSLFTIYYPFIFVFYSFTSIPSSIASVTILYILFSFLFYEFFSLFFYVFFSSPFCVFSSFNRPSALKKKKVDRRATLHMDAIFRRPRTRAFLITIFTCHIVLLYLVVCGGGKMSSSHDLT